MRRAISGITIALVLTVTGCGGQGVEPSAPATSATSEPTMSSSGTALPEAQPALRDAVERYAELVLAGDVDAAMESMTALCARNFTVRAAREMAQVPELGLGSALTFASYAAEIDGDSAIVSYTYAKAHPLNVRNEPWHREEDGSGAMTTAGRNCGPRGTSARFREQRLSQHGNRPG